MNNVTLSNGRIVAHRYAYRNAEEAFMQDGGIMSNDEWNEYSDLVQIPRTPYQMDSAEYLKELCGRLENEDWSKEVCTDASREIKKLIPLIYANTDLQSKLSLYKITVDALNIALKGANADFNSHNNCIKEIMDVAAYNGEDVTYLFAKSLYIPIPGTALA